LLVDKADFAAGATSASSRMIHGGLRYLENGEFRLVRESLHERNRLLKNAPHAVKPLPTTIPIFSRWSGFANATAKFFDRTSKPSKRGAALVKIGLTLYDLFTARYRVLPTHSFAGRAAALRTRPLLHPGIVCTGAAVAFLAGTQAKIPVWADRSGLGWLMRCIYEPRKFIPRYWSALPLIGMVARYRDKSPVGA
jgi:glycerol-3-phosphate dehydrogenase